MPLDARKIAHIRANVSRMHRGRQQGVVLTLMQANGSTDTLTVNAVWRVVGDFEPTMEGAQNTKYHIGAAWDVEAIFNLADVTLPQLRSCVWATLASGATGAQPGTKYTLLDVEPVGILPGGTRYFTRWTKQH